MRLPVQVLGGTLTTTYGDRVAARVAKAREPLQLTVPLAIRLAKLPVSIGFGWSQGRPTGMIFRWRNRSWYFIVVRRPARVATAGGRR